ncbi:hypothetical protein F2Q69_00012367 [Brassica cretica]|uniref:CCHC-type domain-containing protein n=1 Tax=Brassica cretica TaxID=69181 RepID=A0A8S9R466_BRACR|nr:hypothetical protein F2Q69_00012367 [Brassica cretica]
MSVFSFFTTQAKSGSTVGLRMSSWSGKMSSSTGKSVVWSWFQPKLQSGRTRDGLHGDQDVLNNLTEVRSSDRTDQTDRAVPRASRLELRLEPRPDDLTDRTTTRLPRPTRHSKTHGRARLSLGREETKDGHAFLSGGPSGQSRKRPYLYPVHPSGCLDFSRNQKPLQDDVYFPFKTVVEKKQLIFDKRQFASNEFDFVQKQKKRQNRSNDEKWVRSGNRPFTKAKRSNRVVLDQNELQTYASLEKMLHKAIHAVRQLKRKGNTNTSSAPKQQCKSSYLSNSYLITNEISFDKSKAVKSTSKAHSTRCFKCHRIGHYANKCQKKKPLMTLEDENLETEPEKEEPLPIQKPDQTQDLRTYLFEEEGKDVPRFVDQSIGANQHGDQDDLNNLTEPIIFVCRLVVSQHTTFVLRWLALDRRVLHEATVVLVVLAQGRGDRGAGRPCLWARRTSKNCPVLGS